MSAEPAEISDAPVRADGAEVQILLCGNGPALVRGADAVYDADGRRHATNRPVVAVCRCSRSQRAPWCDGTHKFVRASGERALTGVPPRGGRRATDG